MRGATELMRSTTAIRVMILGRYPSPPMTYYLRTGALKRPLRPYYLGTWGARDRATCSLVSRSLLVDLNTGSRLFEKSCSDRAMGKLQLRRYLEGHGTYCSYKSGPK